VLGELARRLRTVVDQCSEDGVLRGRDVVVAALLAQSARAPRWAPSVMSAIGVSLAGGLLAEVRRQR
jgi:hypothetical protein